MLGGALHLLWVDEEQEVCDAEHREQDEGGLHRLPHLHTMFSIYNVRLSRNGIFLQMTKVVTSGH